MRFTDTELEQLTKLLEDVNATNATREEKLLVTPGVVVAFVLTTLSGLCLTRNQLDAVEKYKAQVGNLPLNASVNQLISARRNALRTDY